MLNQALILATLLAISQARFGQEQVPIPAIAAVQAGAPGVAQTIAGAAVSDILAAANDCAKLTRADQILAELGTGAQAVAAAQGLVAAEKNFNPFAQSIPTICDDPTLPKSQQLRGITPLIDPAVGGSDVANQLSAKTLKAPLDATGKSIADLLAENGFTNFTTQDAAGNAGAAPAKSESAPPAKAQAAAPVKGNAEQCASQVALALSSAQAAKTSSTQSSSPPAAKSNSGVQKSTIAGVDFGLCVPTMKFEGGLNNRPATEFTFLPIDPLVAKGQQEALNPNIITNRICDQLTNVCESNAAAKSLCLQVKAQILALNTRNKATADTWNTALGFAGTVTNPDGGPASP